MGNQSVFNAMGPAAHSILDLTWVLFGVSAVVYVAVLGALAWAVLRVPPPQAAGASSRLLTRSVGGAVAITVLTLVALFVASAVAGRGLGNPQQAGAITVDAIGHQWWWEFQYRDVTPSEWVTSPNELHIPVGVPIVIKAASRDVIHSFWVPNLHGKRDLIPGQITHLWLQADQPGIYRGQCAEFCGYQHARMAFTVIAEPVEKFHRWLEAQRAPAQEPQSDGERQGQQAFLQSTCIMCHTIRGTSAGSRVGPDLTHVGSRMTIGAGRLPNTHEDLARWIRDAQEFKPGIRMPSNPAPPGAIEPIALYLRSLR